MIMFNVFHSYVKNICLSIHIKCITGTQFNNGADDLNERERDAEQWDTRDSIKDHCFRTLILKLVNPLESLKRQNNDSYMNRFFSCTPSFDGIATTLPLL